MNKFFFRTLVVGLELLFLALIPTWSPGFAIDGGATTSLQRIVNGKNFAGKLESLIVDVNGERRRVDPTVGFSCVKGDLLTIVDAFVSPMTNSKIIVEVDGFRSERKGNRDDNDLGKVIDTGFDLQPLAQSKSKLGRHRIRILAGGKLYGITYMELAPPELISLDIEVNKKPIKLRSGDRLSLGPRDGLRVLEVRTNVRGNENVKHDLITKSMPDGSTVREIRFTRGSSVFARIPIDWKG